MTKSEIFALLMLTLSVLIVAGMLSATASTAATGSDDATHNVTLSQTVTIGAKATAIQWYSLDEFTKFVFQLLIPTTTASVLAAAAGAYTARRDAMIAAKVGIAVAVIVPSLILLVVVGLSQTIIPIIRTLSSPFSPELGLYSSIIGACLVGGLALLFTSLRRPSLRIRKIELMSEQFDGYKGYTMKAWVESQDRHVIYDMSALTHIEGGEIQLLRVERYEDNGHSTVKCSLEPYRDCNYAWSAAGSNQIRLGYWPELRMQDKVILIYPEEEVATGIIGDPAIYGTEGKFMSTKIYLSLRSGVRYGMSVDVKGVDVNKNTISAKKAITIKILN